MCCDDTRKSVSYTHLGIQEVPTIIDRLGGGVVHAIGTGGRDLSDKVGAITVKDAIVALENHEPTDVITVCLLYTSRCV